MIEAAPIHREEFNDRLDLLQQIITTGFADLKAANQSLETRLRAVETDVAIIKSKAETAVSPVPSRAQKVSILTMLGTSLAGLGYGAWEVIKFIFENKPHTP